MTTKPYGLVCPISKAAEIIEPRWTLPILSELWSGRSRFNDIRRAVGNVSPGVLSKRLAEMERQGLVERIEDRAKGTVDYVRTQKAIDLEEAMNALAHWAQRNIEAELVACAYDVSKMMWKMRGYIRTEVFPARRVVIRFHFTDVDGPYPTYWLVGEPGREPEMCVSVPDFDVDLYVEGTKMAYGAIVMGRSTVTREVAAGRMFLSGDALLERTVESWMPTSEYSEVEGIRRLAAE